MKAMDICHKMNGTLTVIGNAKENDEYSQYFSMTLKNIPQVESNCHVTVYGSDFGPLFMLAQHKNIGNVETSPVKNPYNG